MGPGKRNAQYEVSDFYFPLRSMLLADMSPPEPVRKVFVLIGPSISIPSVADPALTPFYFSRATKIPPLI